MKNTFLLLVAVAFLGCGKKAPQTQSESKTGPVPAGPTSAELSTLEQKHPDAFDNSLGMVFRPVPGTEVQFCIWETRVKDYAAFAAANAGVNEEWKKLEFEQQDTHPVVNVSWNDAKTFCAWLTKMELAEGKIKARQRYRLPTGAEWSMAVGLGKEKGNTPEEKDLGVGGYPWGNTRTPPKVAGNYEPDDNVDNFEYTSPVGSFAANKLGLHDLGGNVWEWCEDWYDPAAKEVRVLRGDSWFNDGYGNSQLSSFRWLYSFPDDRIDFQGFRCVLASE